MVECALDCARHDRMFEMTGGDIAALAEISATQDVILGREEPDLRALTLLSFRKEQITGRNSDIPANLPAVWALIGQPERAEALARSLPYRGTQLVALAAVIRALNDRQEDARVRVLVEDAVTFALLVPSSDEGASAGFTPVAIAVAKAGYHEEAHKIAMAIADLHDRSSALAGVAGVAAEAGRLDFAERAARSVSTNDRLGMVRAQQEIAEALAGTDPVRAKAAARRTEAIAQSITDPLTGPWALARAASTLAAVGLDRRAGVVAERMESRARHRASQVRRDHFAGELGAAAKAWAQAGCTDRAHALADEAERIARSITTGDAYESLAWGHVVRAWGAVGSPGRAEQVARSIADPKTRLPDLAAVAGEWAEAGDVDRAEEIIRSISRSTHHAGVSDAVARARAQVVQTLVKAGEIGRAEEIVRSLTDPGLRAQGLTEVALAWAEAGEVARARAVGRVAEQLARSSTNPSHLLWDLERVVQSLAAAGHLAEAGAVARRTWDLAGRIPAAKNRVWTLSRTAGAVVATEVVQRAEEIARTMTDPYELAGAQEEIAMAWGRLEDFDRAEDILAGALRSHPRRQVRRAPAGEGAEAARGVRRRDGFAPHPPGTQRAAAGGRRHRTGTGRLAVARRARPGRADPGALNSLSLDGVWTAGYDHFTAGKDARLAFTYHAKNVNLVLSGEGPVTVLVDGKVTKTVQVHGTPSLYSLIDTPKAADAKLELRVAPGIEGYAFTFG